MLSKRVHNEVTNGIGLWWEEPRGNTIYSVTYNCGGYDEPESWTLSYHDGDMPAFDTDVFETEDDLVIAMRKIQSIRNWWRREG